MSSRALRRLRGKQRGQEAIDPCDLRIEDGAETLELGEQEEALEEGVLQTAKNSSRKSKKNKAQKNLINIYELICDAENDTEKCLTDEETGARIEEKSDSRHNEKECPLGDTSTERANTTEKACKKKKKKKKKKAATVEDTQQEEVPRDDLDALLETIDSTNGLSHHTGTCGNSDSRPVLYVEHRNLNPETELKRYFGARAVLGDQRPRARQRQFHRSTWITVAKDTWPRFSRPGISMTLLESRDGLQHFAFVHNRDYQQVQFKFLDAVESMDPNNIVALLQVNPYHVDSLLQLSDVCRIQEDQEMARDLVERALYSFECAFHPVFSLTSGTSRLDYLRPENRAFYLALYKHMMFLEKRGCPRTALEYCKLILSLDSENDPLCMLLLVDFLSLRSREHAFLIRLFEEWEGHRNLSQLPNFTFSVALAYYQQSLQDDLALEEATGIKQKADQLLQDALIMFPGVLMPLLDLCSVQPDAAVSSHAFFGPKSQYRQLPGLSELVSLYVGRCHSLWKEASVLVWLEGNVQDVLQRVDKKDPLVEDCENKRKTRYQSTPRSIHRHVILSEIKGALATLPLEVTTQPLMGFDPLPPLDSVVSYTRPERPNVRTSENSLSLFFRSLLPNFNLQRGAGPGDEQEVARAGRELNQEVNRLMVAMRDMLANIQVLDPPREDEAEPERDEEEWD
uniref:Transcription factor 25 (basic helix-loop-helix) n=1 Tax=Paramormyrops kingsleyae TaxID=1676925 RepID=A0A3B3Q6F1_9TELE|nr:transcription factor 25 [Paramormyrops kingsleyae]